MQVSWTGHPIIKKKKKEVCDLGKVMNTRVPWQRYRLRSVSYESEPYAKVDPDVVTRFYVCYESLYFDVRLLWCCFSYEGTIY